MTSDEFKTVIFALRYLNDHIGCRIHERQRIANREGQTLDVSPMLLRCLAIARKLADRLEAKYMPARAEPVEDEKEDL